MTSLSAAHSSSTNKFPFVTVSILTIIATLAQSTYRVNGIAWFGG